MKLKKLGIKLIEFSYIEFLLLYLLPFTMILIAVDGLVLYNDLNVFDNKKEDIWPNLEEFTSLIVGVYILSTSLTSLIANVFRKKNKKKDK